MELTADSSEYGVGAAQVARPPAHRVASTGPAGTEPAASVSSGTASSTTGSSTTGRTANDHRQPGRTGRHARGRSGPHPPRGLRPTMLAEWTKIRSVRSTVWTLMLFLVCHARLHRAVHLADRVATGPARTRRPGTPPSSATRSASSSAPGIGLGQLTICVLGVLVITTEYSTGVIRSSLLAVPQAAADAGRQVAVFAVLIVILARSWHSPASSSARRSCTARCRCRSSDQNVLRAVLGAGLYLAVLGLFALAIGGLIRHTAGGDHHGHRHRAGAADPVRAAARQLGRAHQRLPARAGRAADRPAHTRRSGQVLSAWQGFGVFCLWTAVLLAAAPTCCSAATPDRRAAAWPPASYPLAASGASASWACTSSRAW